MIRNTSIVVAMPTVASTIRRKPTQVQAIQWSARTHTPVGRRFTSILVSQPVSMNWEVRRVAPCSTFCSAISSVRSFRFGFAGASTPSHCGITDAPNTSRSGTTGRKSGRVIESRSKVKNLCSTLDLWFIQTCGSRRDFENDRVKTDPKAVERRRKCKD